MPGAMEVRPLPVPFATIAAFGVTDDVPVPPLAMGTVPERLAGLYAPVKVVADTVPVAVTLPAVLRLAPVIVPVEVMEEALIEPVFMPVDVTVPAEKSPAGSRMIRVFGLLAEVEFTKLVAVLFHVV